MHLKIFADECVHKNIVTALRENGFEVEYISEVKPGLSDHEIVKLAAKNSAILITEDSDFGEWVFVHGYKNLGVVENIVKNAEKSGVKMGFLAYQPAA